MDGKTTIHTVPHTSSAWRSNW